MSETPHTCAAMQLSPRPDRPPVSKDVDRSTYVPSPGRGGADAGGGNNYYTRETSLMWLFGSSMGLQQAVKLRILTPSDLSIKSQGLQQFTRNC